MPVEVKLHGQGAFGGDPEIISFDKCYTVTDIPQLKVIQESANKLHFARDLSDALTDAGIRNVGSLSYFPSVNEIAYWGGFTVTTLDMKQQIGILFPKSEVAYQRTQSPRGGFTLNPFAFNQKKPEPFGPLLLVKGEVLQDNLPEIIEVVSQAYQQMSLKRVMP